MPKLLNVRHKTTFQLWQ